MSGLNRDPYSRRIDIADGVAVGGPIDISGASFGGIFADSSFDGASLTWEAAFTVGTTPSDGSTYTWFDCEDGDGAVITTVVSAGEYAPMNPALFGARFLRPTANIAQTGAGFLTVVLKG